MATDRLGSTIAVGDTYALVGRVLRVDGNDVVLVAGDGNTDAVRVKAGDVVKIDALAPKAGPTFTGTALFDYAGSSLAPTIPQHFVRGVELTASQSAQDAAFLAYLGANYQPLDADLSVWAGITPASGIGTFLATPSSANLRAAMTDETGTGGLYFAGGALGTPSSGTLTNCTGLPGTSALIDDSGFHGALAGSGVTTLQALAEWIDTNITP